MRAEELPRILEIERRAYPFPWTEGIFGDCLKVGYSAWVVQSPKAKFWRTALMSMAVGEAHILNLCVDPTISSRALAASCWITC